MRYQRGGQVFKTGKLGRVNIVRQQMLLPGEILQSKVTGSVRLTPLRERETIALNARMDCFVQPLRWLYPALGATLTAAAKTGAGPVAEAHGIGTVSFAGDGGTGEKYGAHDLGVGGNGQVSVFSWYRDAALRVWNEWWRWPEDQDATNWAPDGLKAVNLAHSWTRLNQQQESGGLYSVSHRNNGDIDLRALEEASAKFATSQKEHWLAHDRFLPLLRELWRADGTREVDKVPMRLRGAELGVHPRDLYATDKDGLGASAALYNFQVNHDFGTFSAPEHMIVTYTLCLRVLPLAEDEGNPTAFSHDRDLASIFGFPAILASRRPSAVRGRNIHGFTGDRTVLGYNPAGWEWRVPWNLVDGRIDEQNSFPILRSIEGENATGLRDATRVGNIFLSARLGDYLTDLRFSEAVDSPIAGPGQSVMTGTDEGGRGASAYELPGQANVS